MKRQDLLAAIYTYLGRTGTTRTAFGLFIEASTNMVTDFENGRMPRHDKIAIILRTIEQFPDGLPGKTIKWPSSTPVIDPAIVAQDVRTKIAARDASEKLNAAMWSYYERRGAELGITRLEAMVTCGGMFLGPQRMRERAPASRHHGAVA